MLEIINTYNHGFVAIPVIIACKKRGFFDLLAREKTLSCEQMSEELKANNGHFQVALRLLESLNLLSRNEQGKYSLTPEAFGYQAIPEDVLQLYLLSIESYLQGERPDLLRKWIEYSCQRWNTDNLLIADFLDGLLVIPLLLALHKHNLFEDSQTKPLFSSLNSSIQKDLIELFANLGWIELKTGHWTFTQVGKFIKERALNTAVVASYKPMLCRMDDVLFGDCLSVFQRDALGQESHIDRTLNVIGSGFQHQKYFTDLEESILSIFDRFPLEEQPKYIADMGCGDGTLLKRVWETIRFRSARGKAIEQYPLLLIGVDYNEASLTASTKTLADLPHIVLPGDIGQPEQMVEDLKAHGIDEPENILHIRSFLDHDRPFIWPEKIEQLEIRKHIPYQGVYVDRSGASIPPHIMIQSLVEHLKKWSSIPTKHGLIILEVHCLEPEIVYQFLNKSENLHFDAVQGFSQQYLIEAGVFLMAAAEVGLFPKINFSAKYPKTFSFTRITLNYFENRPYKIRHPHLSDLPALINLETQCWPEHLRASANDIQQRIERNPNGHLVVVWNEQIVAVMYSQRITNAAILQNTTYQQVPSLQNPQGTVIQLLAINVLPEFQERGLGDQLREFMLQYCTLRSGIESVVGVTRCKKYVNYSHLPITEYLKLRNEQGQILDPIVRFHELGGAKIKGIIPNYRPEDTDNQGTGILIEYNLHTRQSKSTESAVKNNFLSGKNWPDPSLIEETLNTRFQSIENETVCDIVEECISQIMGSQYQAAYGSSKKLVEMGLDSLDLLELQALLEKRFKVQLDSKFFGQYDTANNIISYLNKNINSAMKEQT
ncbi:GNAT family N-acetyltransferase [Phormidium sp. LEGE 05292]|uniref:GNAT family N-acetyltransferase n=1 Tax=[Phormidium] sp. LEGE 05292 TaxID=767427 RepID=UPI0018810B40|nr:GNAT family N-acetyltransferase [Phormidium sp. LEGE 05292]MBE9227560.1 GNAT family N-acetyltransferase [Phormidium sp. LEGE 05292]